MKLMIVSVLACWLSLCSAARAADDFEFVLAPYALLPFMTGDASVGRASGADVDIKPADVLEVLEFGAMIHAEARHKSGLGVIVDYAFMLLGEDAAGPAGFVNYEADIFQGVLEAYGSYRVMDGDHTLDAYAGIRYWDIDIDVTATAAGGSVSISRGDSWVDPVIGLRGQTKVAERWRLSLQGDIGGFGAGSDFSWNILGGVLWDAWENTSLFFGYRALAVDFSSGTRGTTSFFEYDTITHGPVIGAAFRF